MNLGRRGRNSWTDRQTCGGLQALPRCPVNRRPPCQGRLRWPEFIQPDAFRPPSRLPQDSPAQLTAQGSRGEGDQQGRSTGLGHFTGTASLNTPTKVLVGPVGLVYR